LPQPALATPGRCSVVHPDASCPLGERGDQSVRPRIPAGALPAGALPAGIPTSGVHSCHAPDGSV
jgi:hypothetical protein